MVFERRGVPAVSVITEPFVPTVQALAAIHRMPDLPFVVLPHPITSLSAAQVLERADWATGEVENILLGARGDARPQTSDEGKVEALVRELELPLRADGGRLRADVRDETLVLRLEIGDTACRDCILPARFLRRLYEERVTSRLGTSWSVELLDPRESSEV